MDYYAILEIPRGSSKEIIKKAFHRLAHIHHPDKGGNAETFKKISEAYHELQKGNVYVPVANEYRTRRYYDPYNPLNDFDFQEAVNRQQADLDATMRAFQDAVEEALRKAQYNWGTE